MVVSAWTVLVHWVGDGARTTTGSAVSTSSHRQCRCSMKGSRVGNKSGRGGWGTPLPLTVTVSLELSVCREERAGIWSSRRQPSSGRVKC